MSEHNRNNNPTFRPNQHLFQKDDHQHLNQHGQDPHERDSELLRAIFGKESTANDPIAALERIANQGSKTVKELRSMREAFDDFRDDLTAIAALMTCAILAIGNEEEQKALREYLDDDEDETPEDQQSQDTDTPNSDGHSCTRPGKGTDTLKYALRSDFDMNEVMRAAIDVTEETPATVRTITETLAAYLKRQLKTQSSTAKRFMNELDKAVRKRTEGGSDPTDFDAAVAVVKNALPAAVAAVSDITGFNRAVVDRIAFAELLAAKRVLVSSSRVATGSEARQMMDELEKADLRGAHGKPDTNGVEVE